MYYASWSQSNTKAMKQFLRKAGQRLRQFDDAYTDKIDERIDDVARYLVKDRDLNPLEVMGMLGAYSVTRPVTRKYSEEGNVVPNIAAYGIPAMSAGVKYALPAAGIGLAGKGIYDLTASLNQQTSGTLEP